MRILVQAATAATDVHVEPGTPAGDLRRHLALLTGDARWATSAVRLTVDGAVLDDAHPAGVPPLLPGARASLTPRADDPVLAAARADRHLAVVAGPDAGHVRPLPVGARVLVGGATTDAATWRVDDPALAGARVDVHRRGRTTRVRVVGGTAQLVRAPAPGTPGPGWAGGGSAGRVPGRRVAGTREPAGPGSAGRAGGRRGAGPSEGRRTPLGARGDRGGRVRRRWRRWRSDRLLHVGGTVLALRPAGGPGSAQQRRRARRRPPPWAWSALASAATGVVLAVALRQPLLLVGTVVAAAALLASRGSDAPGASLETAADPSPPSPPPGDVAAVRVASVDLVSVGLASMGLPSVPSPAAAAASGPPPARHEWPEDGTLALVGSRARTLAAARALVLRALAAAPDTALHVRTDHPGDWAWTRWLEPHDGLPSDGTPPGPHRDGRPVLVVADGTDAACARWRALAPPDHRLLVLVPPGGRSPAWASTLVRVQADDAVRPGRGGGRTQPPAELVGEPVAEDAARRLAALRHLARPGAPTAPGGSDPSRGPGRPGGPGGAGADGGAAPPDPAALPTRAALPTGAALGALPGVPIPEVDAVARRWAASTAEDHLRVPLGLGAGGIPVVLDLDADGPHVLVAGTTGAGKSELLTTLVLGLALQQPPRRLALLLADFKGGTALGPLAGLPHVVDHVDDLDADTARRTLVGLRAELRRRERALASAGAGDLRRLDPEDPATPPRLVVVVDELRALADDVPGATEVLARVAAQGRALGVHLVLATQRPAGVVTADLRANVTQRVALRVADEADARDVVDTVDPARLDPAVPGRAVLRVGARAPRHVQVARARRSRAGGRVRLLPQRPTAVRWRPPAPGTEEDDVRAWVLAAQRAAAGGPAPAVPWCPALPEQVRVRDVPPGPGLALALADVPEEQRRAAVRWSPDAGPLLVLGGPRSGRSSTLLAVAAQAARGGADVHALGLPEAALRSVVPSARLGTAGPPDDPHLAGLLLRRLLAPGGPPRPALLLVDRLDLVLEQLGRYARGAVADMLAATWRGPVPGLALAASAAVVPPVTRLLGAFPVRLVLPSADPSSDAAAGVPARFGSERRAPGRAVLCDGGPPRLCQVVLPPTDDDADRERAHQGGERHALPAPVRVVPLPLPAVPAGAVPPAVPPVEPHALGLGGDTAEVVHVDAARPLVVAGPPGTGRTSALRAVARGWAAQGHRVLRVTADPPGAAHADDVWVSVGTAAQLADAAAGAADRTVVVVDDADELERLRPADADALEALLSGGGAHVAALATTTAHAAAAFRGPVARALRARQVLVLDPHDADAGALLGPGAALHADPLHRVAGRGVLRRDRELLRVQVYAGAEEDPL